MSFCIYSVLSIVLGVVLSKLIDPLMLAITRRMVSVAERHGDAALAKNEHC